MKKGLVGLVLGLNLALGIPGCQDSASTKPQSNVSVKEDLLSRFIQSYGPQNYNNLTPEQKANTQAIFSDPENRETTELFCLCYENPAEAKKLIDQKFGYGNIDKKVTPEYIHEINSSGKIAWELSDTEGDKVFCYYVNRKIDDEVSEATARQLIYFLKGE